MSVDIAIQLLSSTDGRDKVYKTMENLSKFYGCFANQRCAGMLTGFAQRVSDGRSLMRLGKWVTNAQKLIDNADKNLSSQSVEETLDNSRVFCDFCYIILDNILYLNRFLFMTLKHEQNYIRRAKVFQFWTFFFACALDIIKMVRKYREEKARPATKEILNFLRNFCDFLVALSGVRYLSFVYRPSAAWLSLFSIVSGSIATTQQVKLLQAQSEK
ncbi:glycosomal membrane protein [Perkinsela sp. CCAP 1560/4]|nr:glycosomal membrane protein [Perkinsela sp. CCAP 1560/4]|eukprot:KNH09353.1 glycosomal membrane protein [Perkinsela sp. CCAP 1560/4]